MKKLQLELVTNRTLQLSKNIKIIIPMLIGIMIFFASCQKIDIEKVSALTNELNAPNISIINSEIHYTENAQMKLKVNSPEINRYLNIEDPYTEFPKGLHVHFYDSLQNPSSFIKANYCIFDETEKVWTAKNDVVVIDIKEGRTLNTEFLVWNQVTKKLYSDQRVKVTDEDGIIHGKGFEANEDFSGWKITGTSGKINITDEK